MLSEKPWKAEAVLRLFVSVLVCVFMGMLVLSTIQFAREHGKTGAISFYAACALAFILYAAALRILGRSWRFENFTRNFVSLILCIYGGFLLSLWAVSFHEVSSGPENLTVKTVVAILSFQGAALVLIHRFVCDQGTNWSEGFGLKNRCGRTLLLGVVVALAVLPVAWGLMEVSGFAMEHLHLQLQEQEPVIVLQETSAWMNRAVLGVGVILIAPAAEETLFRGILYPLIKQSGYPRLALWGTSIFFGAIHMNLAAFVPLTLLAVVLVLLYEKTDNLLAPVMTHTFFNAMNFALLYLVEPLSHLSSRS